MKRIYKTIAASVLASMIFLGSCTEILEEQPRSIFEPGFFKTEQGVAFGLTSMYAHLRRMYGNKYYYNVCLTGTDEATWGAHADGNFKDADLDPGAGQLTPTSSRSDILWNRGNININTASGVIENAVEAGVAPALIAEARFFRAFDYFLMVQTFGGVPLDLGSGVLKFNTKPTRTSVRNTVPEVYTIGIFPDLRQAVSDLPDDPRVKGAATKTVARLFLAKAYLTYGWWLKNPNNIPTYPECDRTDPDRHDAAWYFQQAYDVATEALDNPGPYKLQATFYDVNLAAEDRNMETLLYADHTYTSEKYNESPVGASQWNQDDGDENDAGWALQWYYQELQAAANPDGTGSASIVNRDVNAGSQDRGRMWDRMATPIGAIEKFTDKDKDSRFDGTFVTVYRGNWTTGATLYGANNKAVKPGEPFFTFLPDETLASQIKYAEGNGAVGGGVISDRADYVVTPRGITRHMHPGVWKLGPNFPTAADKIGTARPFYIAKFSELYLVAAEAAVQGATAKSGKSAREMVNVLRERAGKWRWDHAGDKAYVANFSEELTNATPQDITVNYILEERLREFYGEGYRWFDLVRTQKWNEFADTYEICTATGKTENHTAVTVKRNIQPHHYLRPIPQTQIDGMEMDEAEKEAYQNPGY
ncbi:MAG: RagB/SusD family nutrient uptake outer membrane protein [Prevotellaceae bacterium]|jgi:hypothetical protein|nr:RagB/SusD family nutrient uptake outer membrane protein [Prevotellaceae bacterium]